MRGIFIKFLWLCFMLLAYLTNNAQTSKVWVTIREADKVPYFQNRTQLVSNDSIFNYYINALNIITCEKAFPDSRNTSLQMVYELGCNCLQSELEFSLSNYVPAVFQVTPAPVYDTLHIPNDYTQVNYIDNYALNLINAPAAWDVTKGDSNVVLCVADQGYDANHSELVGKYVAFNSGSSTTTHGNAVAISTAGNTNNTNGLSSIGYNCKLGLYGMNYNAILSAAYAGARVINMSWSSGCFYNIYAQQAITEAYEAGAFLVAAAGNGSTCGNPNNLVYPAAYDSVFAVTSIGPANNHMKIPNDSTSTHQHHVKVDLSAPGYDVAINPFEGWYINSSGTSFAAPYVTGTIGLMLSANPCLSRKDIDTILRISSFNIDSINPIFAGRIGAGRLDAHAAVQMATGWATNPMTVINQPNSVTVTPGSTVQFNASSTSSLPLYQWQRDSSGIFVNLFNNTVYSGVKTATLTVNNIPMALNNQQYRCVMTSGYCEAITQTATLSVDAGIEIGDSTFITGDTLFCFGDTVQFTIDTVQNATAYQWDFTGNVNVISGQGTNVITVQVFDSATQITSTPYNSYGSGGSVTYNVSTILLPTGYLTGNPSVCPGDSAVLTMNVTGQGPWYGTINDSIVFSGTSNPIQVVVYPDANTYYILQELHTLDGCSAYPDYLGSDANVSILPYQRDTVKKVVCTGLLPYVWNGLSLTSSGNYLDTISGTIGCDTIRLLQLTVITGNAPLAPASITQTLVSNVCNNRIYRYTAATTANASGYQWTIPASCGGVVGVTVDSGDINSSRIIKLKYSSNSAALITDSIRVNAYNSCGSGPKRSVKLINAALNTPSMPFITVTALVTNVCGERKYRYTAPNLPTATSTATAATGYLWSLSTPTPLQAQLDSGTWTSKVIVIKFVSNSAALPTDSIFLRYASACGYSAKRALKINVAALNPPVAPASITMTTLSASVCGQRRYRFTMPVMPNATINAGAATGYLWTPTGNLAAYGVVDSGTLTSRIVVMKFTSDQASVVGDSMKAQYNSACGYSGFRAFKFSVLKLNPPLAPASITITSVAPTVCGGRIYRYTAPNLPLGTTSLATPTGYEWTFTGSLGSNALIDSGNVNSKAIRVRYTSNAAAMAGDSVKVRYASSCGYSPYKAVKLTNTLLSNCPPLIAFWEKVYFLNNKKSLRR